jgi:DNA mismatch repair protein MutS
MGKRALRERIMKPLTDIDVLNERQIRIEALRAAHRLGKTKSLIASLRRISDLPRLFRRFQIGHGTTNDLLELLTSYSMSRELLVAAEGTVYESANLNALKEHIDTLLEMWDAERIRKNKEMVSDSVGLFHPWRRGIHEALDRQEDAWMVLVNEVQTLRGKMEQVLEESDVITWTLKDDAPFTLTTTNRRGKSLAAVAKRRLGCDVRTITRASSPNTTLETDSIVAANQAALPLRSAWKADVQEQWKTDWGVWFDTHISNGMITALVEAISQMDVELTLAIVSELYGYVRPQYVAEDDLKTAGLFIEDLRHPIIERIHTDTPYVPHTIAYGAFANPDIDGASATCGTLIYGVNASGKSSLGKAIGLAVLMAQCGMPVSATAMKLIPYNAVYTRILGNDNLWAGMSSFVVEMTEFRSILRSAAHRVLVVGDELCAGTETASATAIVAAGIQTLVKRGCHFFFATHLHELATIPAIAKNPNISVYHLSVVPNLENGSLLYDRRLRPGCGSPMYGLEVCRGLDMDPEFLALAYDLRKSLFLADGTPIHTSRYNAGVIVGKCTVCGGTEGLETHHIVPQAAADADGCIRPGKHKNSKDNLAVLCDACHLKHHAGAIHIEGWQMTSYGKQLLTRPDVTI